MVPKDVVCVTVKEYWVKEEWLIEVRSFFSRRKFLRQIVGSPQISCLLWYPQIRYVSKAANFKWKLFYNVIH